VTMWDSPVRRPSSEARATQLTMRQSAGIWSVVVVFGGREGRRRRKKKKKKKWVRGWMDE